MLCNSLKYATNPGAPPKDVGFTELEGHSDVLLFIVNKASHELFFLHNDDVDAIEF